MPDTKKEKPKNPIDQLMKKKIEEYGELTKLFDELVEYIKPIVGHDNEEVNKRVSKIKFKLMMLPMADLIQGTLQSSLGVMMMGEQFKKVQEDFNKVFAEGTDHKDFEKFVRGKK